MRPAGAWAGRRAGVRVAAAESMIGMRRRGRSHARQGVFFALGAGYARSVILRCTARLLELLGGRDVTLIDDAPSDEDWYANLLWIERRKCLLLTHAGTLFPVFAADVRKPDLRPLGPLVVNLVEAAFDQERLPADALGALDPNALCLARTASRRVLGFMNDTALTSRWLVDRAGGLQHADLDDLNRFLRRTLHNRDGYHQPLELVAERLRSSSPTQAGRP